MNAAMKPNKTPIRGLKATNHREKFQSTMALHFEFMVIMSCNLTAFAAG